MELTENLQKSADRKNLVNSERERHAFYAYLKRVRGGIATGRKRLNNRHPLHRK
jgi:hypothetical protein